MRRPIVTLTTDFGSDSAYVGELKASLLAVCDPRATDIRIVDLTHSIQPQNVRQAAYMLAHITPRFPADSIHVAVIDPGVGTDRKILAGRIGKHRYVGPDNGLLSLLLRRAQREQSGDGSPVAEAVELYVVENDRYCLPQISATFHGRDIMAPVAAHLACGVALAQLGPPCKTPVLLEMPPAQRIAGGLAGELLWSDSFGNLITNLSLSELESVRDGKLWQKAHIQLIAPPGNVLAELSGIARAYGERADGSLIALFGSSNLLELAQVQGNAQTWMAGQTGRSQLSEFRIQVTWS